LDLLEEKVLMCFMKFPEKKKVDLDEEEEV